MIRVLEHLIDIVEELKKFIILLGPKLKAVAGNIESIEELLASVKNINNLFLKLEFPIYDKQHHNSFKQMLNKYNNEKKKIQEKTITLIETTFNDLRSSESAFELLQRFINLKSLDHISE